jgi:hypothetical protein
MSQHFLNVAAPAGARVVVFRGRDPACVTRAVRQVVGNGLMLPAGPYRYPYAAVVQLLREAGLFHDPAADTADDVILTRDALADLLWSILRRDARVGIPCADLLDYASARLLADFAALARIAVGHGYHAAGLALGTCGALPRCLQLDGADIREVSGKPAPAPVLSRAASRVLAVMQGAPHPVMESSLIAAADIGARATQAAMRELVSTDLLEVGCRVALGPSAVAAEAGVSVWLETPEIRMPPARLSIQPDAEQANRIARDAAGRGESELAVWCLTHVGPESVGAVLMLAEAAAHCGRMELAHALTAPLVNAELAPRETFGLAVVLALLVPPGLVAADMAESWLRAAERAGSAVRARPLRAGLLLSAGRPKAAFNLLRRTTQAQLSREAGATVLEHEFAVVRCLHGLGDVVGAGRRLRKIAPLCITRAQRRERAKLGMAIDECEFDLEFLSLSAAALDAVALGGGKPEATQRALAALLRPKEAK